MQESMVTKVQELSLTMFWARRDVFISEEEEEENE